MRCPGKRRVPSAAKWIDRYRIHIVTPRAPRLQKHLRRRLEGGPSVFWSIRVYSCPLVVRLHQRSAVFPRMIRTAPRGRRRLGARASRPHPVPGPPLSFSAVAMLLAATLWAGTPHRPGLRRAMASLPVDSRKRASGGVCRGCARAWCGRPSPALPISPPEAIIAHDIVRFTRVRPAYPGHKIGADAFGWRLSLRLCQAWCGRDARAPRQAICAGGTPALPGSLHP